MTLLHDLKYNVLSCVILYTFMARLEAWLWQVNCLLTLCLCTDHLFLHPHSPRVQLPNLIVRESNVAVLTHHSVLPVESTMLVRSQKSPQPIPAITVKTITKIIVKGLSINQKLGISLISSWFDIWHQSHSKVAKYSIMIHLSDVTY